MVDCLEERKYHCLSSEFYDKPFLFSSIVIDWKIYWTNVGSVIHRYPHSPGNPLDYYVSVYNDLVSSMEGSGLYIDTYGFKHEKSNENDRLQYICVKLSHFYDLKAHSTEEHVWRTLVKSYQNSSAVPVGKKTLLFCRLPERSSVIQRKTSNVSFDKAYPVTFDQNCGTCLYKNRRNSFAKRKVQLIFRISAICCRTRMWVNQCQPLWKQRISLV